MTGPAVEMVLEATGAGTDKATSPAEIGKPRHLHVDCVAGELIC